MVGRWCGLIRCAEPPASMGAGTGSNYGLWAVGAFAIGALAMMGRIGEPDDVANAVAGLQEVAPSREGRPVGYSSR